MQIDTSTCPRAVRAFAACVLAAGLLSACGGGGGGGLPLPGLPTAPVVNGRVSASFDPAVVTGSIVEGESSTARYRFHGNVSYTGNRDIYLGLSSADALARDYAMVISGSSFDGDLSFNTGFPAGTQRGELLVLACFDPACRDQVSGSPLRMPLQLDVLPNIQVAPTPTLSRAGREPAPTLDIEVSVPAAAGAVDMDSGPDTPGFSVQWLGNALRVRTEQLSAGTYFKDVALSSRTDRRYSARTRIFYRVDPPPGGQLPLSVASASGFTILEQGQVHRQRLRVQRPTWTDATPVLTMTDPSGRANLVSLGGDDYELSFNASGAPAGSGYQLQLSASALPWGGQTSDTYRYEVGSAFSVDLPAVRLDGTSTLASLTHSGSVTTATAPAARWTARSLTPWVRVLRSSGTTGVDALAVEFDAATVLARRGTQEGALEVSIDRPGTLPVRVLASVSNAVPAVGPSFSAALLPGNATVYLDGVLDPFGGNLRNLQVDGATLQSGAVLIDPRFVGNLSVLRVDLQGLTAGRPVTLRNAWPLLSSQVQIPVLDVPLVPDGQVSLPLNRWHSARYSLRQGALYFAGDGVVGRWGLSGGVWQLQTMSVPGLSDASLYGDETVLLAAGDQATWTLDAATLAVTGSGSLPSAQSHPELRLHPAPPSTMSTLVVAADGAAVASVRDAFSLSTGIAMMNVGGQFAGLTGSAANGTDPGSAGLVADPGSSQPGVGLVRSGNGEWVIGVYPAGQLRIYQVARRFPDFTGQVVPAGRSVRAVSNDGTRLLLDDGSLAINGTAVAGSLAALLPAGFTAGGYGLGSSGRFGLIYLYRQAVEAGQPRAREAAVWTVDLGAVATTGLTASTPVIDRHSLADAVGCNTALSANERCAHEAQVVVAPGDGSAFVLGPRGIAALPLPAAASALRAEEGRRNTLRGFVPGGRMPAGSASDAGAGARR